MSPEEQPTTFCGMPLAQWWRDLRIWEWFLNEHPVTELIELGTAFGGMALFLGMQCRARGIAFTTIDHSPPGLFPGAHGRRPALQLVEPHFRQEDILNHPAAICALIDKPRTGALLLFCDNGDKPQEYRLFAHRLKSGDFIVVHDWNPDPETGEFHDTDMDATLTEVLYADTCAARQSHTRFMRRR